MGANPNLEGLRAMRGLGRGDFLFFFSFTSVGWTDSNVRLGARYALV